MMALVYSRQQYEAFIKSGFLDFTVADIDRAEHSNGFIGIRHGVEYWLSKFIATMDAQDWVGVTGSCGTV